MLVVSVNEVSLVEQPSRLTPTTDVAVCIAACLVPVGVSSAVLSAWGSGGSRKQ